MSSPKDHSVTSSPSGTGGYEIIILAGGLGTRLRSVVSDLPKCMAPVNGKPFLAYVIDYFKQQGIEKFIFSLGYKHEIIIEYLSKFTIHDSRFTFQYSIEEEPLGTGGAIKQACSYVSEKNVLVANGDTLFKVNVTALTSVLLSHDADCTLALKPMKNFERYGAIELNQDYSIKNFREKKYYREGLINGGVYILNAEKFLEEFLPEKFSFETDYLQAFYKKRKMYGVIQDEYFIDIGIPEDYERAQNEIGDRR